jgi:hypothetical protein
MNLIKTGVLIPDYREGVFKKEFERHICLD